MRNHILAGLGIAAAILLFFQNCGMNNNNAMDDSRLLVTPLADSGISIAQGENPFGHSDSSTTPSQSASAQTGTPVVPANAISDLIAVNSPSACASGYKATEFLYARSGFTSAGYGGFFCQLPSIANKEKVVSDVKLQGGLTCATGYSKIGGITSAENGFGQSSICVRYQPVTSASSYFTVIYVTILEPSLPALRCKSGDVDAGNIGAQLALCLHR